MVTIAQLAEHLVVAQKVVGSSPTGHPFSPGFAKGRASFYIR